MSKKELDVLLSYVDMPANKPLEVDRPPDTLCFAPPGFLPATQGQRLGAKTQPHH